MEQRLDKWIASCTGLSRKEVKEYIRGGLVRSGEIIYKKPEEKIAEGTTLWVNGKEILLEEYIYIMLNKPAGVISASRDKNKPTVLDILPDSLKRPNLFPAGRLDKDTVGFLLITNDGTFAHNILSPAHHVPKTYHARLDSPAETSLMVQEFAHGMDLGEDNFSSSSKLTLLEDGSNPLYEIVIYEGFYHQIKRMFGVFGRQVVWLKRVQIGGLALDDSLEEGSAKKLSSQEKESILNTSFFK